LLLVEYMKGSFGSVLEEKEAQSTIFVQGGYIVTGEATKSKLYLLYATDSN